MSKPRGPYKVKPKDYSKGKLETDFSKEFGAISTKQVFNARKAIREGGEVCLLSENMASQKDEDIAIIKGEEIQAWGLNVDSLLVKDDAELYAREIL